MTEITLKPCPFCGSDGAFFAEIYDDSGRLVNHAWTVSCDQCQIDLACGDSTQAEIADLWNARAGEEG
jgi:Lar family restriction alleviation protein